MVKLYFKQAWQLMKQNKLYSSVYVLGTGLAISMTMVLAIVYYIKIAPIYPEMNRNRTLVCNNIKVQYLKEESQIHSLFSYDFVKEHFYTMKSPEVVSAVMKPWDNYSLIELENEKGMLPASVKYTDDKFWKIFNFYFKHGAPFTETDFQTATKTAVVSVSMANKLFGTTEVEGKRINFDGNEYRICGVVRDPSLATPETYAEIWVPFTIRAEELISMGGMGEGMTGWLTTFFLAKSNSDSHYVKEEVNEIIRKLNNSQDEYSISLRDQPELYWKAALYQNSSTSETIKTIGVMLLALLVIPAINLAGMVSARMEKRFSEMGIRKAFGASYHTLVKQILTENFLLTCFGGVLGLLLSYLLIFTSRNWVFMLFDKWPAGYPEGSDLSFSIGMLFNPTVFATTLLVCFILNFLSAIIPIHYGLKKGIVHSLSNNK